MLRKRQVPAVIGWVGLAWLAPIIGGMLGGVIYRAISEAPEAEVTGEAQRRGTQGLAE